MVGGTVLPFLFALATLATLVAGMGFAVIWATIMAIRDRRRWRASMVKGAEIRHGEAFETHNFWDRHLDA